MKDVKSLGKRLQERMARNYKSWNQRIQYALFEVGRKVSTVINGGEKGMAAQDKKLK